MELSAGIENGPVQEGPARFKLAPEQGFEPRTDRLTADCSTAELLRIRAMRGVPRAGAGL